MNRVAFTVNGERHVIDVEPRCTLADALREQCAKPGTNIGCEHGVCGACTVLLDGEPVRSCLLFAVQVDGRSVRTVEGLAPHGQLHDLQRAFMAHHALQCGYCTPGFLMLAAWCVENKPDATDEELRDLIASNLCRCTGYQNILIAIRAVMDRAK